MPKQLQDWLRFPSVQVFPQQPRFPAACSLGGQPNELLGKLHLFLITWPCLGSFVKGPPQYQVLISSYTQSYSARNTAVKAITQIFLNCWQIQRNILFSASSVLMQHLLSFWLNKSFSLLTPPGTPFQASWRAVNQVRKHSLVLPPRKTNQSRKLYALLPSTLFLQIL